MAVQINNVPIQINTLRFSAGEVHVQLKQLPEQAPQCINIRADIQSSDDLMSLLLIHNALTNHYRCPLNLHVEIPYFPYARQDRVCATGQAFSLEVMAKLINDMAFQSLTIWDAHSPVTQRLTNAINIPQEEIIASSKSLIHYLQQDSSVLVCPDKGAKDKCLRVKNRFSVDSMIFAEKIREPETGRIIETQVFSDDLSGKTAIIVDDICDGGRTFIEIAKKLKEQGAGRVILYVTHGIFSKGLDVFDGLIDEIFTSDSLPQQQDSRLRVIGYDRSQGND